MSTFAANLNLEIVLAAFESVLKIRLYPVQIDAAVAIADGVIAEVQTGEGKTFITGAAAAMLAIQGQNVHVATTTDYLSSRDFLLLRPVFRHLGVSAACLDSDQSSLEKQRCYDADIVYGSGSEFGFDYLRDQLSLRGGNRNPAGHRFLDRISGRREVGPLVTQRRRQCVIVDEADSVMIDEAGTPLVLGMPVDDDKDDIEILHAAATLAQSMNESVDFEFENARCILHAPAISAIKDHEPTRRSIHRATSNAKPNLLRPWRQYVVNAIHAQYRLRRNVDYVVIQNDGESNVAIVDPNTGRIHEERSWLGGLHQAVEINENLPPSPVNRTAVQITRQRFLQKYHFVAGLTGTAQGSERDFAHFFDLDVRVFQPHRVCKRIVMPTKYFRDEQSKRAFVVDQTQKMISQQRPVIVATRSIDEAEDYARHLRDASLCPAVLHGIQAAEEAEVIAAAGRGGQLTVATSIAGRGTDISIDQDIREKGGLHLISTQRYDSPRVDRQLAGRVARQGQPGSVQQVVAPTDTIFTAHAGSSRLARQIAKQISVQTASKNSNGVQSTSLDRKIGQLQRQIEIADFQKRLDLVRRDEIIGRIQRGVA